MKSLIPLTFLLLALPLNAEAPAAAAGDNENQSGPGVVGMLVPLDPPLGLELRHESTDIQLTDEVIRVKSEYKIQNNENSSISIRLGIPTISVPELNFGLKKLLFTVDGEPFPSEVFPGGLFKPAYDLTPYMALIHSLSLERTWEGGTFEFGPKAEKTIGVEYELDFLHLWEMLGGRVVESAKYFRYDRSTGSLWPGAIGRSQVGLLTNFRHPSRVQIRPKTFEKSGSRYSFINNKVELNSRLDISLVYDPVTFSVTESGFRGRKRPATLKTQDGSEYSYLYLFDGDLETPWCEAERAGAENFSFEIEWGKERQIKSIYILPGFGTGKEFKARNRIKKALIYFAKPGWVSEAYPVSFDDRPELQKIQFPGDPTGSSLFFQVKEVEYGKTATDTCISEFKIDLSVDLPQ